MGPWWLSRDHGVKVETLGVEASKRLGLGWTSGVGVRERVVKEGPEGRRKLSTSDEGTLKKGDLKVLDK